MSTPAFARPPIAADRLVPLVLLSVTALAFGGLAMLAGPESQVEVLAAQTAPERAEATRLERPAWTARKPSLRKRASPARAAKGVARRPPRSSRSARTGPALGTGGYVCPVAGGRSFSDTWGDPRPGGRRHQGTDILAAYGKPVVAVTAGVARTAYSAAGGISLYLEGTDGVEYFYAHNSRNVVSSGARVAAGTLLGYVGTSGNASGGVAHVHFERHVAGGAVNPYPFVEGAC